MSEMKRYRVHVLVRYASDVEAETEEEAYEMGWDIAGDDMCYENVYSIEVVEE
tara:strand:+ start:459 stop:617 length:159 start_codon:yes stop_codon:yes gene_type:complete